MSDLSSNSSSPTCGHAHENYTQNTARLYDGIVDWYVRSFWHDKTDLDWITCCLEQIAHYRTVADIGSGPGNYAQLFMDSGHDVTCIDISSEMIRTAKARLPAIVGVVSDMRQMPFENGSFDCVFCAYSINHILREDLAGTLAEFNRILRPGGIFCLMLKIGSETYEFSSGSDPSSRGVMCLFGPREIVQAVEALNIQPSVLQYKDDISAGEFHHRKMFLLGSKRTMAGKGI